MTFSQVVRAGAATLLLAGCAHSPQPMLTGPGGLVTNRAAVERASADSARLPYTEADVAFMTGMIAHHAQAIVMSKLVPARSTNIGVRTLAERIINAQQDEIVSMQRWLLNRHQPVPDPADTHALAGHAMAGQAMPEKAMPEKAMPGKAMPGKAMPGKAMPEHDMPGMSMANSMATLMPGMLSAGQLAELDSARGPDFDEKFLTFMIQHHKGAVSMVKDLFSSPGAGQDETVFKFASDVSVDQTTEIARMQRMLVVLKLGKSTP